MCESGQIVIGGVVHRSRFPTRVLERALVLSFSSPAFSYCTGKSTKPHTQDTHVHVMENAKLLPTSWAAHGKKGKADSSEKEPSIVRVHHVPTRNQVKRKPRQIIFHTALLDVRLHYTWSTAKRGGFGVLAVLPRRCYEEK